MVSRKQKFKTVVLVLIFALLIVGGVFGISYYKGGVTFPWQVATTEPEAKESSEEPAEEELKVTVVEADKKDKPEAVKKTKPEAEDKTAEKPVKKEAAKEEEADEESVEEEAETDTADETEEATKATDVAVTGNTLEYYGPLHVEDGKLVDESGNPAVLTGVSSHGLSWYPEYVTKDSIAALRKNWGINVIRLAMYTSDYNGYCVGGDEIQSVLKDNIDKAVEAATENDMYVILDWHILNDGDPNEYKSQAIQFFGEMVRKYEDNDNVIYEICNEPNGDITWSDISKYAKEIIPVIRNVKEDALILVGTPSWSSDLDAVLENPLDYDNIMYTYHFYASSHKSSARNAFTEALDAGLPVFISEYGYVSANGDGEVDTKEASKWNEIIEEYQLSSCIWNLSNKAEGSALINADCDKTFDFTYEDLSAQGQYFFDLLKGEETKANDN